MPSTANLQSVAAWCQPYIGFQSVAIGGNEPLLTTSNMVLQRLLAAPLRWRWNRSSVQFNVTQGNQDYAMAAADYGYGEVLSLTSGGKAFELTPRPVLGLDSSQMRPLYWTEQSDDGAGNITIRLASAPDAAYTGTLAYQRKPRLLLSLADTFSPIPDELGFLYSWGMLSLLSTLVKDGRAPFYAQQFIAGVLGVQDGLSDVQKNIFVGNWTELVKAMERSTLMTQRGVKAGAIA